MAENGGGQVFDQDVEETLRPTATVALQVLIEDGRIDEYEFERLEIVVRENKQVVWRGFIAGTRETEGGVVTIQG